MSDREFVLNSLKSLGTIKAKQLQAAAPEMDGTALNSEADYIPDFRAACEKANMLTRPVGFVCKSTAGRVVRLLQGYDSDIYPAEPEELPAQWGFVWSNDPAHALPFVAISTSPYMTGNVCVDGSTVFRSTIDNNVWSPTEYPKGWEVVPNA